MSTEIEILRTALAGIVLQKDMTLLGSPPGSEFDRGHQLGANKAFCASSEVAQDALDAAAKAEEKS